MINKFFIFSIIATLAGCSLAPHSHNYHEIKKLSTVSFKAADYTTSKPLTVTGVNQTTNCLETVSLVPLQHNTGEYLELGGRAEYQVCTGIRTNIYGLVRASAKSNSITGLYELDSFIGIAQVPH